MKVQILSFPNISEERFNLLTNLLDLLSFKHNVDTVLVEADELLTRYSEHRLNVWEERGEIRLHVENSEGETVFSATNQVEGFKVTWRGLEEFIPKSDLSDTDTELDVIRRAFPKITRAQIDSRSGPEVEKAVSNGSFWMIDDGFITHPGDTAGVAVYLRSVGIFSDDDYISVDVV